MVSIKETTPPELIAFQIANHSSPTGGHCDHFHLLASVQTLIGAHLIPWGQVFLGYLLRGGTVEIEGINLLKFAKHCHIVPSSTLEI
jgi:hypothetical protein